MKKPKTISAELCTYGDFATLLPVANSRAQILRLAKDGKFPPYSRPFGGHSEPHFNRRAIMDWIHQKYSRLLPDWVREVEESGLLVASTKPKLKREYLGGRKSARFNEVV